MALLCCQRFITLIERFVPTVRTVQRSESRLRAPLEKPTWHRRYGNPCAIHICGCWRRCHRRAGGRCIVIGPNQHDQCDKVPDIRLHTSRIAVVSTSRDATKIEPLGVSDTHSYRILQATHRVQTPSNAISTTSYSKDVIPTLEHCAPTTYKQSLRLRRYSQPYHLWPTRPTQFTIHPFAPRRRVRTR